MAIEITIDKDTVEVTKVPLVVESGGTLVLTVDTQKQSLKAVADSLEGSEVSVIIVPEGMEAEEIASWLYKGPKTSSLRAHIDEVLYWFWNPIGFTGTLPRDEFRDYVDPIFDLVQHGGDVANLLRDFELGIMGVISEGRNEAAANMILEYM